MGDIYVYLGTVQYKLLYYTELDNFMDKNYA